MPWVQSYAPAGSTAVSALVAAAPLLLFFALLATGKVSGWLAALASTAAAFILAVPLWGMPALAAVSALGYGIGFALFPILWIVVSALWVYALSVESGQFAVIKSSLARITKDRRLQALFIAFAFGAFLEGAAGFGTPVAITAALLVGLGFDARYAAAICLIANSAPVAFAAAGVPVAAAAEVSGLDVLTISRILGLLLPVLSLVVPLWMCVVLCGWRRSMEVLPAILVAGIAMGASQFVLATYSGPTLTGVASGLITVGALGVFLRYWKPREAWDFPEASASPAPVFASPTGAAASRAVSSPPAVGEAEPAAKASPLAAIRAWAPFFLMSVLVLLWGLAPVKSLLKPLGISFPWPALHNVVYKAPPVVAVNAPYPAVFAFAIGSAPGTAIFVSGLLSILVLPNLGFRKAMLCLGKTLRTLLPTIATVCLVMATATVMNYSGMSSSLALALAATGFLFPLFSPIIGWIGVLLTGSDTSSNALFCSLQRTTAEQLGLNPALMVAANGAGGVTGKMISPQSISVATASANLQGQEGWLFRFTVGHSIGLALLVSALTLLLAYALPGLVPM